MGLRENLGLLLLDAGSPARTERVAVFCDFNFHKDVIVLIVKDEIKNSAINNNHSNHIDKN